MNATAYQHRIVLLTTRFQYPDRRLLFTRARLFPDRIELSGWLPGEVHHQTLLLSRLRHITWRPGVTRAPNAVFHFQDGTEVLLHLRRVHLWQSMLEERLCWRQSDTPQPLNLHRSEDLRQLVAYVTCMS